MRAARVNAGLNRVRVAVHQADVRSVSVADGALVTAGDVFYDRDLATAMLDGLGALAEAGAEVLVGDPYRPFLPQDRLEPLASFEVGVDDGVESEPVKTSVVARFS